jgi:parallel beta-helix repeat protein
MGFTMKSAGGSTGVSLASPTNTPLQNIVVRNGGFRGFSWGVRINNAENCRLEDLFVSGNTAGGIRMEIASGHRITGLVIKDCKASENGFYGIDVDVASNALFQGNMISGCTFQDNDLSGVRLFTDGGTLLDNRVENCLATRNNSGIRIFTNVSTSIVSGNSIINCRMMDNSGVGISVIGINGAVVESGQVIGNHVVRSTTAGIDLSGAQDCLVDGNQVSETAGETSIGIRSILSGGNIIVRNVCTNNTTNFLLTVSEDTFGPIVTTTGALANTGDASHPWANFSR